MATAYLNYGSATAQGTADLRGTGTSLSGNQDISAGTELCAVCHIVYGAVTSSVTAITLGGTNMVSAGTPIRHTTSGVTAAAFVLVNPTTGATVNLSIT